MVQNTLKACLSCSKETTNNKYCSRSCSLNKRNESDPKFDHLSLYKEQKQYHGLPCLWCQKKCKSKYCSGKCTTNARRYQVLLNWINGDNSAVTDGNGRLKAWVGDHLKLISDFTCQECGWRKFHPVDNAPGVQIDHINGDSSDNDPRNLRILCPSCHWATPTYGTRGLVNGEPSVRKQQTCPTCGGKKSHRAIECRACGQATRNQKVVFKIDWPDSEWLLQETKERGFSAVARELKVSDNAIRKHLKREFKLFNGKSYK